MWVRIDTGSGAARDIALSADRYSIGRDPDNDLVVDDVRASRHHAALIRRADGQMILEDLGSTNGTLLDGRRVQGQVPLAGTETIQIGQTRLGLSNTDPGATRPVSAPAVAESVPPAAAAVHPRPANPAAAVPGAAPAGPPGPGPATMERQVLRRSVSRATRRANVAMGGALGIVLVAAVVIALVASGTLSFGPPSDSAVIDAARKSTVYVQTAKADEPQGSGTGWALDAPSGKIVTNFHVVSGGTAFEVGFPPDHLMPARLMAAAPCDDLALLETTTPIEGLATMPLGLQENVKIGDRVVAVGYPDNISGTPNLTGTAGIVSSVKTDSGDFAGYPTLPNVIQTDAAINPGNSGGPLVSTEKMLVGVNTLGYFGQAFAFGGAPNQNQNYAIGVDQVREVTDILRQGRSVGYTGMSFAGFVTSDTVETYAEDLTRLGLPVEPGIVVVDALPGSPAADRGFGRAPILIKAVGDHRVQTFRGYCEAVMHMEAGETTVFRVIPAGQTQEVAIEVPFM